MASWKQDATLWRLIEQEQQRQEQGIELIASENFVSLEVMAAQGTVLTNKYAEGYPNRRYYGGCDVVDQVEQLAIDRARQLFGAEYVNVQPHSGSQANMAVYRALLRPNDTILGMDLTHGGHLTHGAPVNFSGQSYRFVAYGVSPETERLDYEALDRLAREVRPQMIVAGASAYARQIDFERIAHSAQAVDAFFVVDMAHIAGLVAAGVHPSPVPYADVVTSTTHKTLRGPRGGLILARDQRHAKALNSAIFPGIQGGPLEHVIAAKAVAFREALAPEFRRYAAQVVANAQAMARVFTEAGARIISGGTDTHLLLLDVTPFQLNGKQAQELLDAVGITVNKNTIPFETLSPFQTSGIRIGTPAITTRGFDEADAALVAELIVSVLSQPTSEAVHQHVRQQVALLAEKRPLYRHLIN